MDKLKKQVDTILREMEMLYLNDDIDFQAYLARYRTYLSLLEGTHQSRQIASLLVVTWMEFDYLKDKIND